MNVDPVNVIKQLNEWRREWNEARDKRVHPTLRVALDACHALVALDEVRSDTGVLLHERVKSLYHGASSILGGRLQPEDLEVVIKALASARMYYWIRYLNGGSSDELEQLIRRRSGEYWDSPRSLGALYRAIKAVAPDAAVEDTSDVDARNLALLRDGCLADFARLELVVLRYGAGQSRSTGGAGSWP